jgi:hypothetical protein
MRYSLFTLFAAAVLVIAALSASSKDPTVARASFNTDGTLNLPVNYRQWSHVGTSFKLSGINVLDLSPIKSPELLHAYVEPSAMGRFQATAVWPDGTQIVKEYSAIRTGDGCDLQTHVCDTSFGKGIYEAKYDGLAMMVKDSERFPDAPGNWAYVSFGHKAPPYASAAMVLPKKRCQFCHQKLAADSDYVVSRAHIGLKYNSLK